MSNSLLKNLNIYWVIVTSIACWFLFIHSPPILVKKKVLYDPPFLAHLFGAYGIYIACIFNTMVTPTTFDGEGRKYHVIVGRIGMVAGIVGVILGFFCTWWPTREWNGLGFAIGISIGGLSQAFFQLRGYRAIRKYKSIKAKILEEGDDTSNLDTLTQEKNEALYTHIESMIGVFLPACTIPALMRVADAVSFGGIMLPIGILFLISSTKPYSSIFQKRMQSSQGGNATDVPLISESKDNQYT